jgi:hypothetical protein
LYMIVIFVRFSHSSILHICIYVYILMQYKYIFAQLKTLAIQKLLWIYMLWRQTCVLIGIKLFHWVVFHVILN